MMDYHAADNPLRSPGVLISGAVGRMGELCARELARRGVSLCLVDIDEVMVRRLADELGAEAYSFDVLSEAGVRQFARSLEGWRWSPSLLINAAGGGYVRTLGMMRMTCAFSRLANGQEGTIINIAPRSPYRDPFSHAGRDLSFRRLSEGLTVALKRPELQVLTFGAGDEPHQVIDAVRQWHRTFDCTSIEAGDSEQCNESSEGDLPYMRSRRDKTA